ncbi:MAG: RsmB/NOP family class I SAM-dependent RNA methyltransferase [Clostridia bacterium]|nr:RsmB/NOP family class I SAM-dependent RNA methyltransferase [Clostridia bacterium]
MTTLPQTFIDQMAEALKEELPAFLASYDEPYYRGLRINSFKQPLKGLEEWVKDMEGQIPWEAEGRYLAMASQAGSHPLHEAGAYYLQEPSAMIPAAVLSPRPGERVLDLCAAPGGKSTQLAIRLQGKGLLVSNEPVSSRAQVLSRNMERLGVPNGLVVSAMPAALSQRWPKFFDAVMVDAPCSGEGMFRRHPETRAEWTPQSPQGCAKRQQEILWEAAKMVRPGGRLCYATCTLNQIENDGVVEAFLQAHPDFEMTPFALPGLPENNGSLHIYPHRIKGEGHFVALFARKGVEERMEAASSGLKRPTAVHQKALKEFHPALKADGMLGETLFSLPEWPDVTGVKVLRAGVHLGQLKGKVFVPDHALALAYGQETVFAHLDADLNQAQTYLRGETFPAAGKGWQVLCLDGVALGWIKVSENTAKNHYPKGLRLHR